MRHDPARWATLALLDLIRFWLLRRRRPALCLGFAVDAPVELVVGLPLLVLLSLAFGERGRAFTFGDSWDSKIRGASGQRTRCEYLYDKSLGPWRIPDFADSRPLRFMSACAGAQTKEWKVNRRIGILCGKLCGVWRTRGRFWRFRRNVAWMRSRIDCRRGWSICCRKRLRWRRSCRDSSRGVELRTTIRSSCRFGSRSRGRLAEHLNRGGAGPRGRHRGVRRGADADAEDELRATDGLTPPAFSRARSEPG